MYQFLESKIVNLLGHIIQFHDIKRQVIELVVNVYRVLVRAMEEATVVNKNMVCK